MSATIHRFPTEPIEGGYVAVLTKSRTLILARLDAHGDYRIVRSRLGHDREECLRGALASAEPVEGGTHHYVEQFDVKGRKWGTIAGTYGAPIPGRRVLIGGVECGVELTSPAIFVGFMPEDRAWVIPHILRARRDEVPEAHLLIYPQRFERAEELSPGTFYDAFLRERERLLAMADERSRELAIDEALAGAVGEGMIELTPEHLNGRFVARRRAIAHSLEQAFLRLNALIEASEPHATALERAA